MTNLPPGLDKKQLRRALLTQRQNLSPPVWQAKSTQICQQLQQFPGFTQARLVFAYCSHRQEPDLSPLFEQTTKLWALPRCQGQDLIVQQCHPIQDQARLIPDRFGIPTPPTDAPVLNALEVDLLLIPCVAIDRRGFRLGYGGGFYDRFFAAPAWQSRPKLGVVFEFGCLPELPHQAWDIPLDGYVNETGVFLLKAD